MEEPYKEQKIPNHWTGAPKISVEGRIVAISGLRLTGRATELMHPLTRAFRKYDIGEITLTNEQSAIPGSQVNSVLYIGFVEIEVGGVVVSGDAVRIGGKNIGSVIGFSDVHFPNHLNILVKASEEYSRKFIRAYADMAMVKLEHSLDDRVIFGSTE